MRDRVRGKQRPFVAGWRLACHASCRADEDLRSPFVLCWATNLIGVWKLGTEREPGKADQGLVR